jgi:recombination protein RecA
MSKFDHLIKEINKRSKSNVVKVGIQRDDPPRLPSGIFQLDLAMGGGLPLGRVSVVYGPESSMKTSLCLKWIAQAQKLYPEKRAAFMDVEGTLTESWAAKMGVDHTSLAYVEPKHAEQAVDVLEALTYAEDLSVIVVDSLAAFVTQRELDSSAEDSMVGVAGILINKLYRKLGRAMSVAHDEGRMPTVVLINQVRFKIGVMHGDPETMPGGPAFKYASSMTLRTYGKDEMDKEVSGTLPAYKKVSVIIKKHKVPIVAKNCEFSLALQPIPKYGLKVGESYDLGSIMHYLKSLGFLKKGEKSGWLVHDDHGEILIEAKTQDAIETQIVADEAFGQKIRDLIVRTVIEKGDLIEPE